MIIMKGEVIKEKRKIYFEKNIKNTLYNINNI